LYRRINIQTALTYQNEDCKLLFFIIFEMVFWCETWSHSLRKEHTRLSLFENGILMIILGRKGAEIIGGL
jgi:hypothetical protein